uniref:Uncharacterized protein n=1 Tax=Anguilla anguilla TaxID=7936 RepID=A0A0E9WXE0_ANGAN
MTSVKRVGPELDRQLFHTYSINTRDVHHNCVYHVIPCLVLKVIPVVLPEIMFPLLKAYEVVK